MAGHIPDSHREGSDCSRHLGVSLPHCQYLLAHLVDLQSLSKMATPRPPLPDLLRDVWLHGRGVHRWVWGIVSMRSNELHGKVTERSLSIPFYLEVELGLRLVTSGETIA